MDEYIRKQDAVDMFNRAVQDVGILDADDIETVFGMLSSADVVQVRHGKWMKEDRGHVEYCAVCDQCGFDWMWSDRGYFKFCPNCGAKMDGGK
jgi:hypothetical protein